MTSPIISLIVPTRDRTEQLRRLLDSLAETASQPKRIEVVLVLDEDDRESIGFHHDGLALRRTILAPGANMGALNMAGYEASSGQHVMLLNDDVIARSPGWDECILDCFGRFPDDVALVHTNDLLFGET